MKRKGQRLKPLEAAIVASAYKEGIPMKIICATSNCGSKAVLAAARRLGVKVPREVVRWTKTK